MVRIMFSEYTPVTTLPTKDLGRSLPFYQEVLGLTVESEMPGGITLNCGEGKVFLYESQFAGTNKATAMYVAVPADRFDEELAALRDKGVTFEVYELEGMSWQGDVATTEGFRTVWFSDPDGNIINIGTL